MRGRIEGLQLLVDQARRDWVAEQLWFGQLCRASTAPVTRDLPISFWASVPGRPPITCAAPWSGTPAASAPRHASRRTRATHPGPHHPGGHAECLCDPRPSCDAILRISLRVAPHLRDKVVDDLLLTVFGFPTPFRLGRTVVNRMKEFVQDVLHVHIGLKIYLGPGDSCPDDLGELTGRRYRLCTGNKVIDHLDGFPRGAGQLDHRERGIFEIHDGRSGIRRNSHGEGFSFDAVLDHPGRVLHHPWGLDTRADDRRVAHTAEIEAELPAIELTHQFAEYLGGAVEQLRPLEGVVIDLDSLFQVETIGGKGTAEDDLLDAEQSGGF